MITLCQGEAFIKTNIALISTLISAGAQSVDWDQFTGALLLEMKRGDKTFTCTSVAIDKRTLLTSAHCLDGIDKAQVFLGHDYEELNQQTLVVKGFKVHKNYGPKDSNFLYDLGVIKLKNDLPESVKTFEIPKMVDTQKIDSLDRIGFGSRNGRNSRTWTNPQFMDLAHGGKVIITQDHNAVIGDSGGPVYANIDGKLQLLSLHSTLEGESKAYSVFLPYFRDWIYSIQK